VASPTSGTSSITFSHGLTSHEASSVESNPSLRKSHQEADVEEDAAAGALSDSRKTSSRCYLVFLLLRSRSSYVPCMHS
jgi:hypothetical protein